MRKFKKLLVIIIIFLMVSFLVVFFVSLFFIRKSVLSTCEKYQNLTFASCREDMEYLLTNENQSFRLRNQAVWVLGQLADKKSLPILMRYYKGTIPPKESLTKSLSQYELKKAITWCDKGNVTSWMYGSLKNNN